MNKKNLTARTAFFLSSLSYFISGIFRRTAGAETVLSDAINLLAFLLLIFGIIRWQKERKAEKNK